MRERINHLSHDEAKMSAEVNTMNKVIRNRLDLDQPWYICIWITLLVCMISSHWVVDQLTAHFQDVLIHCSYFYFKQNILYFDLMKRIAIGMIFKCSIKKTNCSSTQPNKNETWEALELAIRKGNFGGLKLQAQFERNSIYDVQEMKRNFEIYLWMLPL